MGQIIEFLIESTSYNCYSVEGKCIGTSYNDHTLRSVFKLRGIYAEYSLIMRYLVDKTYKLSDATREGLKLDLENCEKNFVYHLEESGISEREVSEVLNDSE